MLSRGERVALRKNKFSNRKQHLWFGASKSTGESPYRRNRKGSDGLEGMAGGLVLYAVWGVQTARAGDLKIYLPKRSKLTPSSALTATASRPSQEQSGKGEIAVLQGLPPRS